MQFQIKCRFTAKVLFEGDYPTLKATVEAAVKARANLAGADLAGADLADANLARAYLADAYLARANLADAYLADAYLADAYLARADLADAKNAETCRLETGETLKDYREQVVPALIEAGGKKVADPTVRASWNCHSWSNCPMHVVFGIDSASEAPPLLRPRVTQFVRLFDANLLPAETIPGLVDPAAPAPSCPTTEPHP